MDWLPIDVAFCAAANAELARGLPACALRVFFLVMP
jgi:hypothetical protein